MTDGQLLIPAAKAAKKLGMSRWTLKRRIDAKEIKAVKVGPRMFIPQSDIDRLLGIPPAQTSAVKPATANQLSSDGANCSRVLRKEEWNAALMSADLEQRELEMDVRAGDCSAIAAKVAFDALNSLPFKWEGPAATNSPERQSAIEAHHATWRTWREARSPIDLAALEAFIVAEEARELKELREWNSTIQERLNWYMANPGWYRDPETGKAKTMDGRKGPAWR